jgi:hypothetical protein
LQIGFKLESLEQLSHYGSLFLRKHFTYHSGGFSFFTQSLYFVDKLFSEHMQVVIISELETTEKTDNFIDGIFLKLVLVLDFEEIG